MPALASPAARLRDSLAAGRMIVPSCYDALGFRMVAQAGFPAAFLSGFSVSAAKLGVPDAGLLSSGEMVSQARDVAKDRARRLREKGAAALRAHLDAQIGRRHRSPAPDAAHHLVTGAYGGHQVDQIGEEGLAPGGCRRAGDEHALFGDGAGRDLGPADVDGERGASPSGHGAGR